MVIFMTEWVDSDVLNWVGMLRFRHIMSQIAAIIFLVSFTNFILFIDKHGINLTDMHLHLRDQVQDSNTDLDTQLRHSDTDSDTDHDTFVEDHDTIHSYHDTNHDTKRVPLTNK